MNPRNLEVNTVQGLLNRHPVVAILRARKIGKSTLAQLVAHQHKTPVTVFDLENEEDLTRLADPILALKSLSGLVVLDEAQRRPDLIPALRVLADRAGHPFRFLVLGNASPDLL